MLDQMILWRHSTSRTMMYTLPGTVLRLHPGQTAKRKAAPGLPNIQYALNLPWDLMFLSGWNCGDAARCRLHVAGRGAPPTAGSDRPRGASHDPPHLKHALGLPDPHASLGILCRVHHAKRGKPRAGNGYVLSRALLEINQKQDTTRTLRFW